MRPYTYGLLFFLLNIILLGFVSAVTCTNSSHAEPTLLKDRSSTAHYPDNRGRGDDLIQILTGNGYNSLAMMMASTSDISNVIRWNGPATLFAPTDKAFHNSTYYLSPGILSQHITKGVFSWKDLALLFDGTKLDTLVEGRSLVIISMISKGLNSNAQQVYVNGVVVSHPDIFNDGHLAIHGIDKLLVQSISTPDLPVSLYAPSIQPHGSAASIISPLIIPFMLKDSMYNLRNRGYSILALALRLRSAELLGLRNLTIFALNDKSIFSGGQEFINNVSYHVVPDKRLLFSDMLSIPVGTKMGTLVHGQSLILTNTEPVSINNVSLKNPDVFFNRWIAVHGIPLPLRYSANFGNAAGHPMRKNS